MEILRGWREFIREKGGGEGIMELVRMRRMCEWIEWSGVERNLGERRIFYWEGVDRVLVVV